MPKTNEELDAELTALKSEIDVERDATANRLAIMENTIAAMGDALKAATIAGPVDDTAVADIKARVNDFHRRVYADDLFPVS